MASTFTVNNGLEKPGAGEQEGAWGGTLNTNFDIIDRVLSGVGSVALTGTTHTLTTSDGSLSDGQFKVINFTGALGANNTITIDPNDQDKLYFIINSTTDSGSSGPYSVIISQGSGANVTIPNGGFDIVIADGAGSGAAVTSLLSKKITTGQLTTTGNVLIPNAGTIGSAGDSDAIAIASNGVVAFSQVPTFPNDTIETADIQDDAVTQAKIADDAVGADQLASDAVVTASITDANVTTAKIADNAVTLAKMAGLARGKIIVGDSSGDPSALALGSNGQVLQSDGSDLVFGSVSASVALDDIGTGDGASNLATSAGDITIDAQGSNTDIILKGTDGTSDITGIKIDFSEAAQVQLPNDSQALAFGADQDVLLTHVADTGLLLNSSRELQFGDSATHISQSADGTLELDSDVFIKLNAQRIDLIGSSNVLIQTSSTGGSPGFTFSAAGFLTHGRASGAAQSMTIYKNGSSSVGEIRSSTTSTAYITSSDYRLKENVSGITDGIVRLKQLKPSRFNFIADKNTTLDGFLAHEAQAVVPEAVSGTKDEMEEDGKTIKAQGIEQAKLVPLLTAALQEAVTEIESLKTRVSALEGS